MSRSRKSKVRSKFKKWLAIPEKKRKAKTGIGTQKKFANHFGVAKATLSRWKKEPGFMDGVERTRRLHLDEALSDVYESMIRMAKEGDPQAMKMVMEQAGRWKEDVDEDTDVSEEDLEGKSNKQLAMMMSSMLTGPSGMDESVLQARIMKSLGEDIPEDLKTQIKEDVQDGEETDPSGEDDEDEDADEVETEEATPESEEDEEDMRQNEEVEEEVEDSFELDDHLMEGMDDDSDEFDPDDQFDTDEEEDLDDLESTEDFEMPLEW